MNRSVIETILGAVVLLVAGVFLAFAYNATDIRPAGGVNYQARFNAVDGLAVGADVRIGGVKVGTVTDQKIDPQMYQAVVTVSLDNDVKVPEDSALSIASSGLLGDKYVKIEPGHSKKFLEPGASFEKTHDVVSLEEMLGKVIFLVTDQTAN